MEDIYFKTNEDKLPEDRKVGYIVITADKGLASSYNQNILKMAEEHLKNHPNHSLFVLGELGRHYFEQRGIEIEKQFHYTVQNPTLNRARNIAEEILDFFSFEEEIIYMAFVILSVSLILFIRSCISFVFAIILPVTLYTLLLHP